MIPAEFLADADALPAEMRAVLDAELAAGNTIAEVGHSFPAPPAGAYFRMTRPILAAPTEGGRIADASRFHFLLDPEPPPAPYPDMDAIRRQLDPRWSPAPPANPTPMWRPDCEPEPWEERPPTPYERFRESMSLGYDQWKEGVGYDLDALREASPAERRRIVGTLRGLGINGWRDVEALAALDTPAARALLRKAAREGDIEVRMAVVRYAPRLVPGGTRVRSLMAALETAVTFGGLTQTLDELEDFHPPAVMKALWESVRTREGGAAVHLAAMLLYLHGKADSRFDWEHRPFFLRFHAAPGPDRDAVWRELRQRCGLVD